jgi:hypothetical protein
VPLAPRRPGVRFRRDVVPAGAAAGSGARPRWTARQRGLARHLGMPPHLYRQIVDRWGFPWVEGYGITEGNLVAGMPLAHAWWWMTSPTTSR